MKQNNNSNARLLKMISGLQNQITRLERKQPNDVVYIGTHSEPISMTAGIDVMLIMDTVIMNQGIYVNPIVGGFKEYRWIVMSSGMYAITFQLFFNPASTQPRIQMYVGTDQTTYGANRILNIPIGNGRSFNLTTATTMVYLEEGWTFHFTVGSTTDTALELLPYAYGYPITGISIAQVSGAYQSPSSDNEWYFEANEIEP